MKFISAMIIGLILVIGCHASSTDPVAQKEQQERLEQDKVAAEKFEAGKLKEGQVIRFKASPDMKGVLTRDEDRWWGCSVRYFDKLGNHFEKSFYRLEVEVDE